MYMEPVRTKIGHTGKENPLSRLPTGSKDIFTPMNPHKIFEAMTLFGELVQSVFICSTSRVKKQK